MLPTNGTFCTRPMHHRTLTGPHIRLEPVTAADEDELRAALDCDPENWAIQIASPLRQA